MAFFLIISSVYINGNSISTIVSKLMLYFYNGCSKKEQNLILNKNNNNDLDIRDVLIVIKTTESHSDRLEYIISTWYQQARSQVIF